MRVLAVVMIGIASPTSGQSLNIDIEDELSAYGSPLDGYAGAAGQAGTWNPMDKLTGVALYDLAGALTPVEVDLAPLGFWDADTSQGATGDAGALINDAVSFAPLVDTVVFRGLVPGEYEVYSYVASSMVDHAGQNVTVDGVTRFVAGTWTGSHVEGSDYTRHAAMVTGDGRLEVDFQIADFSDYGTFNGFQLVRVGQLGTQHCAGDGTGQLACPCGNDSPTPSEGCLNTTGSGMRLWATGSGSIASDDTALTADRCPPGNTGLFFVGQGSIAPGQHLFDGIQCAVGPALRFPGQFQSNGIAWERNLVAQDPSGMFFTPGTNYYFQYFTRDNQAGPSPCGGFANLSPTLRVVFSP